ncbi:PTS system beta-glucoside-specific IIA component, Glc family /PTS system beta-glucoside-specific IIB component, Glc family /PTS system beta-glucoside-specific IIC component, Glc family [Acetitomaculum ruminis DSM 5522]|uniref:PTS system beta-glucoside-specific IIA component, Glc family /PTS system beta-glucoside-specific IIB component, Glc family /PTS system beta-glucoside-specific IIC component, Glc family n=1 Tax=Acetitomaculum ruminis DSM 5522 TaxID=1120918 RepID=A0A1I1A2J4_9FIRM|nr:beta-glucoside-specific PTS transporter subunit IIABC [Acetitomaculum ruminis]SFB30790.1 PTS system beta-glucoside-specific IIA component, Glc family /PTS system beta-glucoside-specific IIB component, Glc family /PTS system beta-glucoside-specific IIC component, Glc family [Acetitomaculum ruminis DSM 5522]
MALDYKSTADKIIEAVGGKENIASATHCMTRLRMVLVDEKKANDDKVNKIKGVKSVIKQGGQYQVVIGNEVSNLFKEFKAMGFGEEAGSVQNKPEGNIGQRLLGFISGCLTPLLPAILGAGMLKVVLTLCTTLNVLESTNPTYTMFYAMADAFFYFLPIFLGWSIAKKTGGSIPLYLAVGAMLCYPDLTSLLGGAVEGVKYGTFLGSQCTYLFGVIPVIDTSYTSSVVPMLLMAPVMMWAEEFADKVSPNVLKAFLKPLIFMIICVPVVLVVLGPLGGVIGNGMAFIINSMYNAVPWLTVGILSAIMPFIVMTGMHYALIPICINNMATLGWDVIVLVTMFCSNICQGGAAFGVAAKTKDVETRSEGIACGISATIAGVTEPAMYGINLRFGKPMIAAVTGAGISGLLAGITSVKGYSMGGSPSFLSLITFIGGDSPYAGVIWGAICGALGLAIAAVLSFIMYSDKAAGVGEFAADSDGGVTNAPETIYSPIKGKLLSLSETPDDMFASGTMGEGVAIEPVEGKVFAPADGEISAFFETGHAIGITTENGAEILIHVGMNTVELKGEGFTVKRTAGDKVRKGDLLLEFDIDLIKNAGYPIITPVIVTNSEDYTKVSPKAGGVDIKAGDSIIDVE